MPPPNDWNNKIIEEFRANAGKVGGNFKGFPLVVFTHTGAKSGKKHTTPVMYLPDGDRYVIFASMGGAPKNPAWYHNLVAHPDVQVEVGTERFEAKATVKKGKERDELYARQVKHYPQFGEYAKKTTRTIPVIVLERRKAAKKA